MLENPRWERFCQLYAVDGNASAAYTGAGYSPRSPSALTSSAYRLLKNDDIRARIAELTEEARLRAEQNAIADITEIRQRVTEVLRGHSRFETKASDIIKAGDFLARVGGQVEPPKVQVQLTLEDKQARLQELIHGADR